MSLDVTMASVFTLHLNVTVTMTVETTVMKISVVNKVYLEMHFAQLYYLKLLLPDGLELDPCPAMQSIVSNMEVADPSFFCTTADPCNTATCVARDGQKLQITLLNCNTPTAIRLINRDRNGRVLFNHTFDHSETVPAIIGGASITLNVTIVHHSGLLGLRVS